MAAKLKRPPVARLLVAQSLLLVVVSMGGMLAAGVGGSLSALTGSGVALVPNAYFVWRAFRYYRAPHSRQMVNGFYRAAAGKFGLTVALFTLVFVLVPPSNPTFFFGAYVATLLVHWLGPWLLRQPSNT
ncbi:ATP synthase subunit I [Halomonas salinarum]|uniref:ATP synthase subunit I n=1 Tax=Halomonas salinarum TaxID=1158993 RepID=UPI00143AC49F|nr:ATP synthase subunit I [Halomonas salinarum]